MKHSNELDERLGVRAMILPDDTEAILVSLGENMEGLISPSEAWWLIKKLVERLAQPHCGLELERAVNVGWEEVSERYRPLADDRSTPYGLVPQDFEMYTQVGNVIVRKEFLVLATQMEKGFITSADELVLEVMRVVKELQTYPSAQEVTDTEPRNCIYDWVDAVCDLKGWTRPAWSL